MSNMQLSFCCEQKLPGLTSRQHSTATKPLILAADDDEDNLLLLAYALEPLGCDLITATDGATALLLSRTYQPDLILLDVLMPCMDGIEVVWQVRKDPALKTTPMVAITALAIPEERSRLLSVGFDDYISKPYMLEDIEATVCRYLPVKAAIS